MLLNGVGLRLLRRKNLVRCSLLPTLTLALCRAPPTSAQRRHTETSSNFFYSDFANRSIAWVRGSGVHSRFAGTAKRPPAAPGDWARSRHRYTNRSRNRSGCCDWDRHVHRWPAVDASGRCTLRIAGYSWCAAFPTPGTILSAYTVHIVECTLYPTVPPIARRLSILVGLLLNSKLCNVFVSLCRPVRQTNRGFLHAGEAHKSELFKCRIAAAQALAEKACDELEANPPDPSFATAHLNIATYANGVRGLNISSPSMTLYQPRIPIAVEPRSDFVSQGIMSSGATASAFLLVWGSARTPHGTATVNQ